MITIRQLKRSKLSRVGFALLRFAVRVLPLLAGAFTAFGVFLGASTYEPRLTKYMLAHYPRYRAAQDGLVLLQDLKYSLKETSGKEVPAAVVDIDHASWPAILEFVQSEIAIRKSERNESGAPLSSLSTPEGSPERSTPVELPPIDFGRIKTIVAVEIQTPRVGPKPLAPPYRLIVLWPHSAPVARRVYEFLSFQEFALDLRQMFVLKLRYFGILASGIAFATTIVLASLRWALRRFAPGVLATTSPGLAPRTDAGSQRTIDDGRCGDAASTPQ
jgi:hypothetical protein